MTLSKELKELIDAVRRGERRAIARAITLVENPGWERWELLGELFPSHGTAYKIGITGAPGVGKSSLIQQLLPSLKARGYKVGVLAVDPTSPFSGGALLGDRVRMQERLEGTETYMRSLASRGSLGGLSRGINAAIHVLEAAGYEIVLIETVGSGQLQVEVRYVADTVILLLVPEAGDVIQAMKAGIIEIADLYVINKADREGAAQLRRDLRAALELGGKPTGWNPPILLTEALTGKGMEELVQFLFEHRQYLHDSGDWEPRRLQQLRWELEGLVQEAVMQQVKHHLEHLFDSETLRRIYRREENPYPWLEQLWQDTP